MLFRALRCCLKTTYKYVCIESYDFWRMNQKRCASKQSWLILRYIKKPKQTRSHDNDPYAPTNASSLYKITNNPSYTRLINTRHRDVMFWINNFYLDVCLHITTYNILVNSGILTYCIQEYVIIAMYVASTYLYL